MDKPTAEDTVQEIKEVDLDKKETENSGRPKSEYTRKDRHTIRIGLALMVVVLAGALFYLLNYAENSSTPLATQDDARSTSSPVSALEQVKLQEVPYEGSIERQQYIVFFSDAIGHFVPIDPIPETLYQANIVKVDSSAQINEHDIADELKDKLLDESFESYTPEKPEISANDDIYGIRRYRNASIYCTIQVAPSASLSGANTGTETVPENNYGYVKKMCADESEVRYTAATLNEFYTAAMSDNDPTEGAEYNTAILILDSGTRLSPIDGYEYKEGVLGSVGSTAAVGITFVRFEQQDWEPFRFGPGNTGCDSFDTQLIQNALVSYTCIHPETDAETTVGSYYNLL